MTPREKLAEKTLVLLLRIAGVSTLFAFPCIFLPEEWMSTTHQWLGFGDLPRGPMVTYMARSLSMFYGVLGLFTLAIAQDWRRYAPLVRLWAYAHILMGALLVLIDLWSDLPGWWVVSEGGLVAAAGVIALVLQHAAGPSDHSAE